MSAPPESTLRLTTGGWVTGVIVDSDDEHLVLANITERVRTLGLVDPTPGAVVPISLDLVVGIDAGNEL